MSHRSRGLSGAKTCLCNGPTHRALLGRCCGAPRPVVRVPKHGSEFGGEDLEFGIMSSHDSRFHVIPLDLQAVFWLFLKTPDCIYCKGITYLSQLSNLRLWTVIIAMASPTFHHRLFIVVGAMASPPVVIVQPHLPSNLSLLLSRSHMHE